MTEASTTSPETSPAAVGSSRRAWGMAGSLVLAFGLLIALTWMAGGFDQRNDLRTVVSPGTTIATGPYEFTFTAGTAQKTKGLRDIEVYRIVLSGTGRVTGDVRAALLTGGSPRIRTVRR